MKRAGVSEWQVLGECKGAALELQKFQHPFTALESLVVLGDHVTTEAGTGAVHTAPATVRMTMLSVRNMASKPPIRSDRMAAICRAPIRRWMGSTSLKPTT